MGGEKKIRKLQDNGSTGSPPHGRGKEGAQLAEKTGIRITPAWAGKSGSGLLFHRVWWEHPRVGGEKQHFPAVLGIILGSPPHGRGKVAGPGVALLHPGITPAWAGKRSCKEIAPLLVEDHPRVGGEKFTSGTMYFEDRGSPPRGRGKGGAGVLILGQIGITPA